MNDDLTKNKIPLSEGSGIVFCKEYAKMFKYYMCFLWILAFCLAVYTYRTDEAKLPYRKVISGFITIMVMAVIGWVFQKEQILSIKQEEAVSMKPYVRVEKMIYASVEKSCTCVMDKKYIDIMIEEVGEKKDATLYDFLLRTGELILIKQDTLVSVFESEEYRGFVPVIFMEGDFKGRRAYVLSSRLESIR